MYLIREISELADELKEKYPKMTDFEMLQIASKVQYGE